jgi:4'-phosphopantetheinyl transferase
MISATTPRLLGPPAGIVDVWRIHLDAPNFPREEVGTTLDPAERAYAARLTLGGPAWADARGAQRVILAGYRGVPPGALRFTAGDAGKPRLAASPGLEFSFARTRGLALLAVTCDRAVGVDVERENPTTDIEAVAADFLEPAAVAAIHSAPPEARRRAFFRAWTQHEARLKLHGEGLLGDPRAYPRRSDAPSAVRPLALPSGFAGAVTALGDDWTVSVRDFPPPH